jgi:hypothetical protein
MSVASSSAICSSSITVIVAGASSIWSGVRVAVTTIWSSPGKSSSAAIASAGRLAAASAASAEPSLNVASRWRAAMPEARPVRSNVDPMIFPVDAVLRPLR